MGANIARFLTKSEIIAIFAPNYDKYNEWTRYQIGP